MEIGLFYQLPAWPEQRPGDRYEDTLRQIELGDTLGFSVAWLAELHFESSRGIMPSPFLVAAAAAQRTQRIGLGTAVVLLPLHDPLRLAEETAMLDHLSRGRLRLGIGRGHGRGHYGGFGIDVEERTSRFDEALEVMRRAWRPEPLRFRGRHFAYDGVSVVPKPLRQPHPPLLMAANSDDSVEAAIALEIPVMMATVTATPEQIEARSRRYRSALPAAPERDVALLVPIHVAETDALARRDCEASHLSYYHDFGPPRPRGLARGNASGTAGGIADRGPHRPLRLDDVRDRRRLGHGGRRAGDGPAPPDRSACALSLRAHHGLVQLRRAHPARPRPRVDAPLRGGGSAAAAVAAHRERAGEGPAAR